MASALGVVIQSAANFVPFAIGFVTSPSPDVPFRDPWLSMMEVLIRVLSAPLTVMLAIAIHSAAPSAIKPFSFAAVVFMGIAAGITCSVHLAILNLSRRADFASLLDSVASHVPMAFGQLHLGHLGVGRVLRRLRACLVPVFSGSRLHRAIKVLLLASGVAAIAGLAGIVLDDRSVRNVGIMGYAVVYPAAAVLMIRYFQTLPDRG